MERRGENCNAPGQLAPVEWAHNLADEQIGFEGLARWGPAASLPPARTRLAISLALLSGGALIIGALLLLKLWQLVKLRRAALAHFKRGNIKVAGAPKLFNGHLDSAILREDNVKRFHAFHQQLGKTFALFYGPDPWVLTVDLELIKRVFVSEGSVHVDNTLLRLPFVSEFNESLAQIQGDRWRQVRRLMSASFTPKRMKSDNVFDDIHQVGALFEDFVRAHKRRQTDHSTDTSETKGANGANGANCANESESNGGFQVDVNNGFKRFSLEVLFRVVFGRAHMERLLPEERDELIDWVDEGSQHLMTIFVQWGIMFGPVARRLLGLGSHFTPLGQCIRYVHSIVSENLIGRRELRQERVCEQTTAPHTSGQAATAAANGAGVAVGGRDRKMIDSLIESFEAGRMDDEALKANLFFMMMAGFETSANTLTFMFWLLARHPDQQERLRAGLAEAGPRAPYLEWVLNETLRLHPAVPAPIGRILEHDIQHGELLIKKGVTLVASIWSLHRWPDYWGADVDQFRPERFGEPVQAGGPLRFFAFAAGPRYCIGQHLAVAEIKALAARLLTKYRVSLPPSDSGAPLDAVSPNMIHFIIRQPVELIFTEISQL